ncbi:hypothetical protein BU16DRAFT_557448 [Lophium mytilinum]|uniref:Uncharacterized protein n=1 Tax=Lophium mytilinum TaxID=390894 RepID=A0A6A6R479_9PEZI|nr:hypothetical protein BU16DRAFT_557448 [Lophium mytilinum]
MPTVSFVLPRDLGHTTGPSRLLRSLTAGLLLTGRLFVACPPSTWWEREKRHAGLPIVLTQRPQSYQQSFAAVTESAGGSSCSVKNSSSLAVIPNRSAYTLSSTWCAWVPALRLSKLSLVPALVDAELDVWSSFPSSIWAKWYVLGGENWLSHAETDRWTCVELES